MRDTYLCLVLKLPQQPRDKPRVALARACISRVEILVRVAQDDGLDRDHGVEGAVLEPDDGVARRRGALGEHKQRGVRGRGLAWEEGEKAQKQRENA